MIEYTITPKGKIPANLHLIDSYKVSKKQFDSQLKQIKALNPESEVWHRGFPQMKLEWACHNAAYALHYQRERTKDCDLDYPQKFLTRAVYAIVGILVWPFIK